MLARLRAAITRRKQSSPLHQAEIDFAAACPLLELNESIIQGQKDREQLQKEYEELRRKWQAAPLGKKIVGANNSITVQLAEMFQHLHDIDSGDIPVPAEMPGLALQEVHSSAAFQPSPGPSTHTNPQMTLAMQMKSLHSEDKKAADIRLREALKARLGFALWQGPSQAPTEESPIGVYLKGKAAPGAVIGLYPGSVYNSEMLQKPIDCGHLGNPAVKRLYIPRLDDCVLDVWGGKAAKSNPFAMGQHVRHPPRGILPNVMRLQYDFMAASDTATAVMPFPPHLRDYIPNSWGSKVSVGQELFSALEQHIWAKGIVLIALRPLWNEELYVDHALNPFALGIAEGKKGQQQQLEGAAQQQQQPQQQQQQEGGTALAVGGQSKALTAGNGSLPSWYSVLDLEAHKRIWNQHGR